MERIQIDEQASFGWLESEEECLVGSCTEGGYILRTEPNYHGHSKFQLMWPQKTFIATNDLSRVTLVVAMVTCCSLGIPSKFMLG